MPSESNWGPFFSNAALDDSRTFTNSDLHSNLKMTLLKPNHFRLKSRKPYKYAQEMLSVTPEDRSKDAWIAATWKQEWEASGPNRVHRHVSDPGEGVKGEDLSRKHWTTLNRLRTGVGRYNTTKHP